MFLVIYGPTLWFSPVRDTLNIQILSNLSHHSAIPEFNSSGIDKFDFKCQNSFVKYVFLSCRVHADYAASVFTFLNTLQECFIFIQISWVDEMQNMLIYSEILHRKYHTRKNQLWL